MTQDTRKDRRVKIVSLNVRYKSATVDEFIENHAHDVSRGGIFIKTANPFPPGTLLKFEIRLASDQAVIAGVGRVVWKRDSGTSGTERPAGMGVKFIKIDEPSKAVVDKLINTRTDAGISFEASEPAPAISDAPPSEAIAAAARAATPSAAVVVGAVAAAGPGAAGSGSQASGVSDRPQQLARKATVVGLGSVTPAAASGAPRPASVPPRPGTHSNAPATTARPPGGPMFPKAFTESERPPKEELTVMRQAAELLEDALRQAGGSLDEVGDNPLFSPSKSAPSALTKNEKSLITDSADGDATSAGSAPPSRADEDAGSPRRAQAAEAPVETTRAKSKPASRAPSAPAPATPVRASDASAAKKSSDASRAKKKSGAGLVTFLAIAAAAVVFGLVMFREQLFGSSAPPEPTPSTSSASHPMLTPPMATPPAAITAPTMIHSAEPPPAASASDARPEPTASAAASSTANASPPPAIPAPRPMAHPRPAPKPAPPPPPAAVTASPAPAETTTPPADTPADKPAPASDSTATPPAATSTASAAAAATASTPSTKPATAPAPKGKSGKKDDDNPY